MCVMHMGDLCVIQRPLGECTKFDSRGILWWAKSLGECTKFDSRGILWRAKSLAHNNHPFKAHDLSGLFGSVTSLSMYVALADATAAAVVTEDMMVFVGGGLLHTES